MFLKIDRIIAVNMLLLYMIRSKMSSVFKYYFDAEKIIIDGKSYDAKLRTGSENIFELSI